MNSNQLQQLKVRELLESIAKELENLNIQAEAMNLQLDSLSSDDLTDMLKEFCVRVLGIYIVGRSILTDVRPDEGGGSYVS